MTINQWISEDLSISLKQVDAAVTLLCEGATVPFIARYRKEKTGGLDDSQLRSLNESLLYYQELEDRKQTVLKTIDEQGKLTADLKTKLNDCKSKTLLEDLYLPFKPKRRTKAQIAKEAGLEPLAIALLNEADITPETAAVAYLNEQHNISSVKEALEGAKQILMETFSENAELLQALREYCWKYALISSEVQPDKSEAGIKFKDYFQFSESFAQIPSHRALALFRGRKENILYLKMSFADEQAEKHCVDLICRHFNLDKNSSPAQSFLNQVALWTWKVKLSLKLELELFSTLRENAEVVAINVFKDNLKNLLMCAPAGHKVTLGLDPGYRTGVKLTVVDETSKLLAFETIFPHAPQKQYTKALATLRHYIEKYKVQLIAIGNGTASRETEQLVQVVIKSLNQPAITKVVVSEAGASVYSASELAAKEFPGLDVSYRGAVSIARRLQDPLAELVKIDPKSIGVGQYQHDVNQIKLSKSLEAVMEDCVSAVGADINTASAKLLASISGLNERTSQNIVTYREQNGAFLSREDLKKVPQLGEKTYEQAIGFLRIMNGKNPLDASAVHPESYPVVKEILTKEKCELKQLMGNSEILLKLNPRQYISDTVGLPTIKDILAELQKPGRYPRPEFETAKFLAGVETLADVKPGMKLEGVVTNVTNFGAFVDVGVHQDGLVHISELADKFIKDAKEVVKVGQIVKTIVLEVDVKRKRLQLSMKSKASDIKQTDAKTNIPTRQSKPKTPLNLNTGFADALKLAMKNDNT